MKRKNHGHENIKQAHGSIVQISLLPTKGFACSLEGNNFFDDSIDGISVWDFRFWFFKVCFGSRSLQCFSRLYVCLRWGITLLQKHNLDYPLQSLQQLWLCRRSLTIHCGDALTSKLGRRKEKSNQLGFIHCLIILAGFQWMCAGGCWFALAQRWTLTLIGLSFWDGIDVQSHRPPDKQLL